MTTNRKTAEAPAKNTNAPQQLRPEQLKAVTGAAAKSHSTQGSTFHRPNNGVEVQDAAGEQQ